MAKRLLLDALVKVLGEFIELNEENLDLSLAVWSGQIVLHNLKLKTDKILRNFNVSILHGSIRTLEVTIPWTALLNSPVKVLIDGVFLQVGPLDLDALDKEETRKRLTEAKIAKLDMVDKMLDYTGSIQEIDVLSREVETPELKTSGVTYVQAWTSKIVDNIEITLRNVHMRYEDSTTIPGVIFSAGLTLESFIIATCNDKWQENFVTRNLSQATTSIRKIVKIQNVGVYWNTNGSSTRTESFEDWLEKMQSYIMKENEVAVSGGVSTSPTKTVSGSLPVSPSVSRMGSSDSAHMRPSTSSSAESLGSQDASPLISGGAFISKLEPPINILGLQYIFAPPNKLVVKLIHTEGEHGNHIPTFDLIVESSNLTLAIDQAQLRQLSRTVEMLSTVERKRQPFSYRPFLRPTTKKTIRLWWQYAMTVTMKKKRYVSLVKKSKAMDEETGWPDTRTNEEKFEMKMLEEKIPLHTLVIFRHAAAKELQAVATRQRQKQEEEDDLKRRSLEAVNPTTSWWGSWMVGIAPVESSSSDGESDDGTTDDVNGVFTEAGADEEDDNITKDKVGETENRGATRLKKKAGSSHSGPGVAGGHGSSTGSVGGLAEAGDSNDMALADIIAKLEAGPNGKPKTVVDPKALQIRLSLVTSASLELFTSGAPIAKASMGLSASAHITGQAVNVLVEMRRAKVIDLYSPGAIVTDVLTVKRDRDNPFSRTAEEVDSDANEGGIAMGGGLSVDGTSEALLRKEEIIKAMSAGSIPQSPSTSPIKSAEGVEDEIMGGVIEKPTVSLGIEIANQVVTVRVDAVPVEIVANKPCLQQIIATVLIGVLGEKKDEELSRRRQRKNQAARVLAAAAAAKMAAAAAAAEMEASASVAMSTSSSMPSSPSPSSSVATGGGGAEAGRQGGGGGGLTSGSPEKLISRKNRVRNNGTGEMMEVTTEGSVNIIIELQTPMIIIPEDCASDDGYLLLDLGLLSVHGIVGAEGNCWDVGLKAVNVGLPVKIADRYLLEEQSLYLIKPFDVAVQMQTIDKSVADMTVDTAISPQLRGELDAMKLSRLLRGLREAMGSLLTRPEGPPTASSTPQLPLADIVAEPDFIYQTPTRSRAVSKLGAAVGINGKEGSVDRVVRTLCVEADARPELGLSTEGLGGHSAQQSESTTPHRAMSDGDRDDSFRTCLSPGYDFEMVDGDDSDSNSPHDDYRDDTTSTLSLNGDDDDDGDDDGDHNGDKVDEPGQGPGCNSGNNRDGSSAEDSRGDAVKRALALRLELEEEDQALMAALQSITPQSGRPPLPTLVVPAVEIEPDPTSVGLDIRVRIPSVVLNLTYNTEQAQHLVLRMQTVDTHIFMRPHDFNLDFHLSDISIQDSFRSESQRNLAWSPKSSPKKEENSPISISYTNIKSRKSPFQSDHGSVIKMIFSHLALNADVQTLSHLKPFTEVLLRRPPPPPPPPSTTVPPTPTTPYSAHPSSAVAPSSIVVPDTDDEPPKGLILEISFHNFSLDLLRVATMNVPGEELQSAFSWQLSGLVAVIEMRDLMKANVRIRSADIFDTRKVSADHVFKKLFCPVYDVETTTSKALRATVLSGSNSRDRLNEFSVSSDIGKRCAYQSPSQPSKLAQKIMKESTVSSSLPSPSSSSSSSVAASAAEDGMDGSYLQELLDTDLLEVVYYQEAKNLSFVNVVLKNTTSFVHVETILDLTQVFIANFFGFLDLLSNPAPPPPASLSVSPSSANSPNISTRSTSLSPLQGVDDSTSIVDELLTQATLNVNVKILNPRLIILDDPTTDESRAIVSKSEFEVHYSRETRQFTFRRELQESLHVSLRKNEIFVVMNMLQWSPQPVLEPFGLEFHLRRRSVDGTAVSSDMSLDTDNLKARVSINDFRLVQSILSRSRTTGQGDKKAPSSPQGPSTAAVASAAAAALSPGKSSAALSPSVLRDQATNAASPTYTLQVTLGSIAVVAVYDYNSQNIPIMRALIDGATFYAEGFHLQQQVKGEGSFIANMDFYNSALTLWEPVLDRWHPSISIVSADRSVNFEIKSEHTMQITVSGIMLEKLLKTYSLLLRLDETFEREFIPEVMIQNSLGVPIEIYDSATNTCILELDQFQTAPLPKVRDVAPRKFMERSERLPAAVDIHFSGELGRQRRALLHLPFNINKPRIQNLQHNDVYYCGEDDGEGNGKVQLRDLRPDAAVMAGMAGTDKDVAGAAVSGTAAAGLGAAAAATSLATQKKHRNIVMEPILEEVYENSRYDLLTGHWRAPYLPGDPHHWTDASLTIRRDIQSIQLISDKWEWMDGWNPDTQGQVGVELDEEGWEYATSFSYFSIASQRRTSQPMDSCRRRRWTRTRVPAAKTIDERFRPLALFWDVQPLSNGAKLVDVRSGLQLSNKMPFPIRVSLSNNAWGTDFEFGPISEGEVRSVPLLRSFASALKVMPASEAHIELAYTWSRAIACSVRAYDYSASNDLLCESPTQSPLCFKIVVEQTNRTLIVTFVPYIVITNRLPCDLHYRCKAKDHKCCDGVLVSGESFKLSSINLAFQPRISVKVGNYAWSCYKKIDTKSSETIPFELASATSDVSLVLSVTTMLSTGLDCGMRVDVFSKSVLIDKTGLNVSVWGLHGDVQVIRNTYRRPPKAEPLERVFSSVTERRKRLSAFRAVAKSAAKSAHAAIVMNAPYPSVTLARSIASSQQFTPNHLNSMSTAESTGDDYDNIIFEAPRLHPESFEGDDHIKGTLSSSTLSKLGYSSSAGSDLRNLTAKKSDDSLPAWSDVGRTNSSQSLSPLPSQLPSPSPSLSQPLEILHLQSDSSLPYATARVDIGELVYSDRKLRWTHLPAQLRNQRYIRTPCDDKNSRSRQLIRFEMSAPAIVLVAINSAVRAHPKWLYEDGFKKISQQCIARMVSKGVLQEVQYNIYGRIFEAGETVYLRGAWCKDNEFMYVSFVIPIPETVSLLGMPAAAQNDKAAPSEPVSESLSSSGSLSIKGSTGVPTGGDRRTQGRGESGMKLSTSGSDVSSAHHWCLQSQLESVDRIYEQIAFGGQFSRSLADDCWTEGTNGLSLFYAETDTVAFGVADGSAWSDNISINMTSDSSSGSFEVVNWETMKGYQMSYSYRYMPGLFNFTQQVTLIPRYCIVNCLDETVMVVQRGSREVMKVEPFKAESWHKSNAALGTAVQIRCRSSLWSLGSVDINEIGSSVIHLPPRAVTSDGSLSDERAKVIQVEVKIADPSENCSIVVVIWEPTMGGSVALSIRNEADLPVTIKQAGLTFDESNSRPGLFDIVVQPTEWKPFGWADPDAGENVLVTVGANLSLSDAKNQKKRIATISLLKAGEMLRLPDNTGRSGPQGEVVLSVLAEKCGRVLRISRYLTLYGDARSASSSGSVSGNGSSSRYALEDIDVDDVDTATLPGTSQAATLGGETLPPYCFALGFRLASFGISLVLDKPVRREFLSLYIDGLEGRAKFKGKSKSFEFVVSDLQIDNYSETALYPVLLYSTKKESKSAAALGDNDDDTVWEDAGEDDDDPSPTSPLSRSKSDRLVQRKAIDADVPLVQLTLIKEQATGTSTSTFKYVAFRLLPLIIDLDSATLQLLYFDLLRGLKFVSTDEAAATSAPRDWMSSFNTAILAPINRMSLVDVYKAQVSVQESKMYFEKLIVHPIKITLTFAQTLFPRKRNQETLRSALIDVVTSLAAVDRMQLRLKSFEVEDALESRQSLMNHITRKTWQDLQAQLGQIAGSLAVFGSPIGFARKVGHGVQAFFYEPYQGLVHSPHDFVVGIGKGTSSLITDVVSGAMNSTVAFAGTASKSISYLSGDSEYVRKRALKRQRNRANRGGIFDGFMEGGESVVSGFASGVSGLVTKPFEEARKSGVQGFFKGIGLGLIGAAVKPVLGISDGISSVASGIQNQVGAASIAVRVRPARALERSAADVSDSVIVPLNLEAASAQEFLLKRAKSHGYEDSYLLYIPMDNPGEAIILSDIYLYWRRPHSLWGRTWANISHCFCSGSAVSVLLYGGSNGLSEVVAIPCGTAARTIRVYAALERNAHRMGNPSNVVPVEMISGAGALVAGLGLDLHDVSSESMHTILSSSSRSSTSSLVRSVSVNEMISIQGREEQVGGKAERAATPAVTQPQELFASAIATNSYGTARSISSLAGDDEKLIREASVPRSARGFTLVGELDSYRFGAANCAKLKAISGPESDVLKRAESTLAAPFVSWEVLDQKVWRVLWEWECTHMGLQATRCSATILINRSDSPIQIVRIHMLHGRNVSIIGSVGTGYDLESRSILPDGYAVVLMWAFAPSPIEVGHLKAKFYSAAFDVTIASTQRETSCESRGGFSVGFLEKTVTDGWSKYVILVT